jgi:Domain of unknown function (DUF6249)
MDGFWSLGVFVIPIVAIIGGILSGIVHTVMRARVRELEIRERIAMIERGLVPTPESDPETFDRRMHSMDLIQREHVAPRHRSAGVVLMAVGLGMMVLLTYAGNVPRQGLGVGGFIMILGLGFVINSLFASRPTSVSPPSRSSEPPAPPNPGS